MASSACRWPMTRFSRLSARLEHCLDFVLHHSANRNSGPVRDDGRDGLLIDARENQRRFALEASMSSFSSNFSSARSLAVSSVSCRLLLRRSGRGALVAAPLLLAGARSFPRSVRIFSTTSSPAANGRRGVSDWRFLLPSFAGDLGLGAAFVIDSDRAFPSQNLLFRFQRAQAPPGNPPPPAGWRAG